MLRAQQVSRPGRRLGSAVTTSAGLLAAVLGCAFLAQGLSRSTLPVAGSLISELEARNQPGSGFFRAATLLSGVAAIVFAAGLRHRLPPGRWGTAGCWAISMFGAGAVADALLPMDCASSVDSVCRSLEEHGALSWPHQAHTWSSAGGTVALLASTLLLGRHLRNAPGWQRLAVLGRVGGGWLIAYSCVVTVMTLRYLPDVGLAQRLQELGFSGWLVVLACARPVDGPG